MLAAAAHRAPHHLLLRDSSSRHPTHHSSPTQSTSQEATHMPGMSTLAEVGSCSTTPLFTRSTMGSHSARASAGAVAGASKVWAVRKQEQARLQAVTAVTG